MAIVSYIFQNFLMNFSHFINFWTFVRFCERTFKGLALVFITVLSSTYKYVVILKYVVGIYYTQENPIAVAVSTKKECNIHSNSIAVLTRKSVAKELHTLPNYTVGHF